MVRELRLHARREHWLDAAFLAQMAIMQPIDAQNQVNWIKEIFKGGESHASRPVHLTNAGLDEMLEVAVHVYVPSGQQDSRWIGQTEFSEFAEVYAQNDNCFGFGDDKALSAEIPFGSDTALIRLRTGRKAPRSGSGLLVTLQLPRVGESGEIANECAYLNFLEALSWTGFPLFGCWHRIIHERERMDWHSRRLCPMPYIIARSPRTLRSGCSAELGGFEKPFGQTSRTSA